MNETALYIVWPMSPVQYIATIILWVPGVYSCYRIVCEWISCRKGWKYRIALTISCWMAVYMVMFIGDLGNLPPTLAVFMAAVFWCGQGSRWQKLAVGMVICTEAFAFNTLLDSLFLLPYVVAVALRTLFWTAVWLLLRRREPLRMQALSDRTWKQIGLMTITPFGIVLSVMLLQSEDWNWPYWDTRLLNITVLILAVSNLIVLMQVIPSLILREELEERNRMYEMNRVYYENLERQQTEIRILRHDMANHLSALASLPEPERQVYLEKLVGELSAARAFCYCAHPVINGVINGKAGEMERLGIRFTFRLDVPSALPVEGIDLCALVGNSLDNAMEACQKLEQADRFIDLTIRAEKGLLVLQVVNGAPRDLSLHYGLQDVSGSWNPSGSRNSSGSRHSSTCLPGTTKKTSQGHGFGLRSIQEVTARYGGNLELSAEDGRFTLFLYLPLGEREQHEDRKSMKPISGAAGR